MQFSLMPSQAPLKKLYINKDINMKELCEQDILSISGGKKFFEVLGGALFGGIIEGFLGFFVAGPPGFVVGFGHGVYEGAAVALLYEGGMGMVETLHTKLG